ncbi:SPOR domain-containing protein [Aquiflexum lacus]|uniref:SPOR domain-containing protein n=1 Tax=Aquiflexum lacus TaxID=2483805 RepID=UPI001895801A|nr:SPOR domain-containing protein [Aquiflexum lacus]
MTERENQNKPNIEDKDYGFPFVEVTPIASTIEPEKSEKSEFIKESIVSSDSINPVIQEKPEIVASPIKIKSEKKIPRKTKSQVPLLLSLVFLIVIILGSIAYFLYYLPESGLETYSPTVSEESISEEPLAEVNEDLDPESDEMEDLGSSGEAEIETPDVVESPEVFTPEIIVVDRRGQIPYYNVIVASSPNERIARAEAQKMIDKGRSAWIIFPFGNTNNYRISVGRYEDLESATKAMETAKVELNESSWILKY